MNLDALLGRLWGDYVQVCPDAFAVHRMLAARGEQVLNDHVAFRAWGIPGFDMDAVARAFVERGYRAAGEYRFDTKKLTARHYQPPRPDLPRVFVSQLDLDRFDSAFRKRVEALVSSAAAAAVERQDFCAAGRLWTVTYSDYEYLRKTSEYAAWLSAFGFRANHFTVNVNALETFGDLQSLCDFLQANGLKLNTDGGVIKGSPEQLLEQASTLAGEVSVMFDDGARRIPGCYYEFARRHLDADGRLFNGFVTTSADRLFTSTNRR